MSTETQEAQREVARQFCELASRVNREVFDLELRADCFCTEPEREDITGYHFNPSVFEFIEDAVQQAIARQGAK